MIDPALFDAAAVSDEIRAQNETILARLAALPDPPRSRLGDQGAPPPGARTISRLCR